ncbi:hypothetical protein NEFER03_1811 [Nematocida sp. LUAm3]|nr:hypothetical protein NEFER03_1811 [Nematocida sp. LUAm3]KAI5173882.1 hypothetical protein NEFER02_0349 [Nematocida sp. LUAm2]KAI5177373.1 hypothetical protein NEFER01_0648 [Nematocida sp. LUAm1]
MSEVNILYYSRENRPVNPIMDILIFEREIKKKYSTESKRRVFYFIILLNTIIAYILYVTKHVYDTLCEVEQNTPFPISMFLWRIYIKMLGNILLISYIFIRLFRRSSKVIQALSNQLKLLNIYIKNDKILLCQLKTPYNIRRSLDLFREEEEKRREAE